MHVGIIVSCFLNNILSEIKLINHGSILSIVFNLTVLYEMSIHVRFYVQTVLAYCRFF